MKTFKALYITDRFFIVMALVILSFVLAFIWEILFVGAIAFLALTLLSLIADIIVLFHRKSNIKATRKTESIASLHSKHLVRIFVKNIASFKLHFRVIDELPYQLEQRDFKLNFSLASNKSKKANYTILPQTRGEYEFGFLNIFCQTQLGFCARREQRFLRQSIAVMPSVVNMRQQELIATRNLTLNSGETKSKLLGKSYEFDQMKPLVVGDDPRNINWKASSKLRQIMVNHFEDERSQQVYSIIDKGRNMKMPFNGLTLVDYAINATLAFTNIVLKKHDKAGLISFSEKIDTLVAADRSPRQLRKIQHALYAERYHYTEPNFEYLTISLRKLVPNRSLIFLYTNFDTLESLQRNLPALKIINRQHQLVMIFFKNTELEDLSKKNAENVLDIYTHTMAQKFIMEKRLIVKELMKHGITSILTEPEKLSANTINKYLEMKASGVA